MYDPVSAPARLVLQSGIEGIAGTFNLSTGAQLAAASFAAQWLLDTLGDDITTVATTPGYITNAKALRMSAGDLIWIRNTSNNRVWLASINSVGPVGATIDDGYQLVGVGQVSPVEAAWSNLTQGGGAAGRVMFTPGAWPVTFAASGVFGAGGSVSLQGSNDGITWTTLTPPALTAPGPFKALHAPNPWQNYIIDPSEIYIYGRPITAGGDATTAINVTY